MNLFQKIKIFTLIIISLICYVLLSCSKQSKNLLTKNFISKDSVITVKVNKEDKQNDYYNEDHLRYEDYIYKNNIKTVLLYKDGWELSLPIIELNSDKKLKLSFDDLDIDSKNYKYTIIHCDASWQASDIAKSEYIDGFTQDYINNYQFSFNTIQKYTHYELIFPTENLKITKSGNYILKVFVGENEKNIAFTKKFMIFENKVTVNARVKQATDINDRFYKQQIDFIIKYDGYKINDPYTNIKVIITQNQRWDNAILNLKPVMIKDNQLIYEHNYDFNYQNVINGGNEFRHFDMKSIQYNSDRIKKITYDSLGNHIFLLDDDVKTFSPYYSNKDINGKKLIKTDDPTVTNSNIEADYVYVHFSLPYKSPLINGSIYILGALTNWFFTKDGKMKYNYNKHAYETSIYLKQGYYNYQYVFLKNGKNIGDETFIEGNHSETENDYTIYVYNKETFDFYDKLIAVKNLNSMQNN